MAGNENWIFTEKARDCGASRGCCGVCGRRNLRFQFQVRNMKTHQSMWVGSSCILKFGLSVMSGGTRLPTPEAKAKLARIMRGL